MKMNALANIPRDASISASELASKIGVDQLLLSALNPTGAGGVIVITFVDTVTNVPCLQRGL